MQQSTSQTVVRGKERKRLTESGNKRTKTRHTYQEYCCQKEEEGKRLNAGATESIPHSKMSKQSCDTLQKRENM